MCGYLDKIMKKDPKRIEERRRLVAAREKLELSQKLQEKHFERQEREILSKGVRAFAQKDGEGLSDLSSAYAGLVLHREENEMAWAQVDERLKRDEARLGMSSRRMTGDYDPFYEPPTEVRVHEDDPDGAVTIGPVPDGSSDVDDVPACDGEGPDGDTDPDGEEVDGLVDPVQELRKTFLDIVEITWVAQGRPGPEDLEPEEG